jgi:hypothetical protein
MLYYELKFTIKILTGCSFFFIIPRVELKLAFLFQELSMCILHDAAGKPN